MWSLESNWKRQEGSCHPFLKILILLLHKCKLNSFQWISIYFIYQIKLSSYCNSPSFFAQTCVRDFSNWRILTSGLTAHLTHHSLCQVLIRRQTSIDTRDFLFRTKWTSILVKKSRSVGCVFHLSSYSVGKSSCSSKNSVAEQMERDVLHRHEMIYLIFPICTLK